MCEERRRVRVLVVEDDAELAEAYSDLLADFGVDARVVGTGRDAIGAMATFEPHLAFVDIGLPDMSGYDVARQLRTMAPERALLLVAASGFTSEGDIRGAGEAGFDRHLAKPFHVDELLQVLAHADASVTLPPVRIGA